MMKASFKNFILLTVVFCVALSCGLSGGVIIDRRLLGAGSASTTAAQTNTGMDLISQAWNLIKSSYVDQSAATDTNLAYGSISGMVDALGDTGHSRFMTPAELKQETSTTSGTFEGIGAEVSEKNGQVIIAYPLSGSPAEKAGIRAGDVIVAVDGVSMVGLSLSDVTSHILGNAGTTVKVTVQRPSTGETLDFSIVRAKIKVNNVAWATIPGTTLADVRISTFSTGVSDDLKTALKQISDAKLTGIVLDLRDNPGGLLDEAVSTASQFLGSGYVLEKEDAGGKITKVAVESGGLATSIPLIVLVNADTASASEIVAGAIQDNGRAKLLGTTTYGTGTILNQFNLSDGSALLLATEEWLTPKGNTIWHKGITPDVALDMASTSVILVSEQLTSMKSSDLQASTDVQLLKAIELLSNAGTQASATATP